MTPDIPKPSAMQLTSRGANLAYVRTVGCAAAATVIAEHAPAKNSGRQARSRFIANAVSTLPAGVDGMVKAGTSAEAIAAWISGWSESMAEYIRADGGV